MPLARTCWLTITRWSITDWLAAMSGRCGWRPRPSSVTAFTFTTCAPNKPRGHASPRRPSARPQILDMDITAQSDVIGQVPSLMVRVFIDGNLIVVPAPIAGEIIVVQSQTEGEAAEPEALPVA